ncbi:MAG: amidohydrolase family protein [Lautropia sp.]
MIIDCDSHIMPGDAFAHVDPTLAGRMPTIRLDQRGAFADLEYPGNPAYIPGTTPLPPAHPSHGLSFAGNTDMEARMADYQAMGIDAHLALPQLTGWWSYLIEPATAAAMAHSWNLSLLELMERYPGRVLGAALVALQDVDAAIRELRWAARQGFSTVMLDYIYPVPAHPFGTTLASHRELWPFFEAVEALDIPIILHAVQHGHRILNCPRFLENGLDLCAPSDAQLNLVSLIASGLLDDFPGLKFIYAETGTAYIKPLATQMDARFGHTPIRYDDEGFTAHMRRREHASFRDLLLVPPSVTRERNLQPPSHYFRKNIFWTIETEEPELAEAIAFAGATQFLFATDYPHNDAGGRMKFEDVRLLDEHPAISDPDKELIRCGNARRLFKLD